MGATEKSGERDRAEEVAREAWALLAGLVYPPPFLSIAHELGLRPPSLGTLRILDRPRTMSEVAEHLRCDNSNVTGIVDALEGRGLAVRQPSEQDRRVKLIALTAAGKRLRRRLMRAMERPPDWLAGLSERDQRALRELLRRAEAARVE